MDTVFCGLTTTVIFFVAFAAYASFVPGITVYGYTPCSGDQASDQARDMARDQARDQASDQARDMAREQSRDQARDQAIGYPQVFSYKGRKRTEVF
ncbi:large tegument protein deneddylase [Plakobranchus ocellatus]|uniref:Large tegument protein deneddylase n=1 Tax=Plakobranchus ocellatus TaxID=259542 RepID=A0AAV3XW03_9GAST|nr:large tegument protein deneddylase [Plakobranchus ocellatus]